MKKTAALILTTALCSHGYAADNSSNKLDAKQIYFGGGVSLNDIDIGDDAVGFQLFTGIPIPVNMGKASLLGEVGYMDSGDFDVGTPFGTVSTDADGIWANAVIDVPLQDNIGLIGRIGLDFGDDDGLMIGGGLGFNTSSKLEIRVEYVIRDTIDSLQANIVIRQ